MKLFLQQIQQACFSVYQENTIACRSSALSHPSANTPYLIAFMHLSFANIPWPLDASCPPRGSFDLCQKATPPGAPPCGLQSHAPSIASDRGRHSPNGSRRGVRRSGTSGSSDINSCFFLPLLGFELGRQDLRRNMNVVENTFIEPGNDRCIFRNDDLLFSGL